MSLTAYVRYDNTGRIVPGGPIVTSIKPKVGDWVAVNEVLTTTPNYKLRGFIRYIKNGNYVAGSLILQHNEPQDGNWKEVYVLNPACCAITSTTTTTTTAAPYTEYLALFLLAEPGAPFPSAFPSTGFACAGWTNPAYSFYSVYAAESSIGSVTYLYADSGLTTPVVNTSPSVAYNTIAVPSGLSYTTPYTLKISGGAGQVSNLTACP